MRDEHGAGRVFDVLEGRQRTDLTGGDVDDISAALGEEVVARVARPGGATVVKFSGAPDGDGVRVYPPYPYYFVMLPGARTFS